ncbi:MAG: RHS repeat-associated core domain-containing protein, partial [Chloroflexi bacterium]|nr:RHS repeat-associated core domain-containing protein [Chloroflexota bacterium]
DGLGSARVEMVGNAVDTTTTYEPYGRILAQTGTSGTTYGYTGEQHDALTNLVYLRARYYNPSLKVFMSRDPFPGVPTMPASQHGYSYVHNNPVNLTDPSGEIVPVIIGGIIIAYVTAVTWDVMVNQGASSGGADQIFNGQLLNKLRCKVNWEQAKFYGEMGAFIGAFTAPAIYATIHYAIPAAANAASSGLANAGQWAAAHGTSAMHQFPRLAGGLQKAGKLYGAFEFGSDIVTVVRGFISNDPQAQYEAATTLYNPATGVSAIGDLADSASDIFFKRFKRGTTFSAAFHPDTGTILMRPSTADTSLIPKFEGPRVLDDGEKWVSRSGGHLDIVDEFKEIGISGNELWGFALTFDDRGRLNIESWKSSGIQVVYRELADPFVPKNVQLEIIQALEKNTGGWNVTNNPSVHP